MSKNRITEDEARFLLYCVGAAAPHIGDDRRELMKSVLSKIGKRHPKVVDEYMAGVEAFLASAGQEVRELAAEAVVGVVEGGEGGGE